MDGKTKQVFVGIDFGTCNLKARKFDGKIRQIRLNKKSGGGDEVPNVIYYGKTKDNIIDIKIGATAKKSSDYTNKILHVKRHLEEAAWSQFIPNLGKDVNAVDVTKDILTYVWGEITRQSAQNENYSVCITVPVNWATTTRKRIREAAILAHIPDPKIITEPFAALFSLEDILEQEGEKFVLVFDFGGSTLDLSLLQILRDGDLTVRELSAVGMNYGGLFIDEGIYDEIFAVKYKAGMEAIEAADDLGTARKELLELIAGMKESLFGDDEEEISDFYTDRAGKEYEFEITREEIIAMLDGQKVRERITLLLNDLFDGAEPGMKENVTMVAPFGGSSNIPYFMELLRDYFGESIFTPEDIKKENLYLAVAGGAARYLSLKQQGDKIESFIPFNIGLEREGRFKRYIRRGERTGFETRYDFFYREELLKNNFRIKVYQAFSNKEEACLGGEEGAIYLGEFQLEGEKYSNDKILFKLSLTRDGNLRLRVFERHQSGEDAEIIKVEEKDIIL